MAETAEKTNPTLWEKVKKEVTTGDKGGKPGQWSARKAQLAVHEYKEEGGGYKGKKDPHNHLTEWTEEKWGTKSGKRSQDTGERYLPEKAREKLSDEEYKRTTAKKRADTRRGKQFSAQPKDVAAKVRPARGTGKAAGAKASGAQAARGGPTVAELRKRAAAKGVAGRSRMNKDELLRALG